MGNKYIIKKGRHNRLTMPGIHLGITELKFRFKFDENCIYPIVDTDDFDLNKLYGFSQGLHHHNSIRIAWRPDETHAGKIQLYTYIYNNKVRVMNLISSVECEKWYVMEVSVIKKLERALFALIDNSGMLLSLKSENFIVPKFRAGYFLDLFMGGNKPARQDTSVWIEKLK